MQTIQLNNVNKSFGSLQVLANINLRIEKGEFAAIVGPSGCGKSTILRMIAGLEEPTTGEVLANDTPIVKPDPRRVLIFQEHALYPWRTVEHNVGFGMELAKVPVKERQARIHEILDKVGLVGFEKYYPRINCPGG